MSGAADRAAYLLELTERLTGLIAEENDLLAAKRYADFGARQPEKLELARAYERELAAARANPGAVVAGGEGEGQRLKAASRRLRQVLEQNRQAVSAAKTVTERILKAIADEIRRRQQPVHGYGKDAAMAGRARGHAGPVVALALDRTV